MRALAVLTTLAALAAAAHAQAVDEPKKLVSLYGANPNRLEHRLPQEHGIRSLFQGPLTVAYQMPGQDEIVAYSIGGIQSMPKIEGLSDLLRDIVSGEEKVALFLSAARDLDIPQMKLPIRRVHLADGVTLETTFRNLKTFAGKVPWLFLVDKKAIPAASLSRQVELGQFGFYPNKVVLHSAPAPRVTLPREGLVPVVLQRRPAQVFRPVPVGVPVLPQLRPGHFVRPVPVPVPVPVVPLRFREAPAAPVLDRPQEPLLQLPGDLPELSQLPLSQKGQQEAAHVAQPQFLRQLTGDLPELSQLPGELSELAELSELVELPQNAESAAPPAQ